MKRLHELRPADLERAAVWHYLGETDDTAQLRATTREALSERDDDAFVARTQFTLANGAHHVGICSPAGDEELDCLQPVIITPDGPAFFWFAEPPSSETLDRQWQLLGAPRSDIFPVHYRCLVPVDGRYVTGVIEEEDLTGAA